MRRRLLVLLLFGLGVTGGALATWHARNQALLVQYDLATARGLLAEAGGFQAGKLEARHALIDRAEAHTVAAEARLGRWPLRQLGILPLLGRDVRVARAVTGSATSTITGTRRLVTALEPVQAGPPTRASILHASDALLGLQRTLAADLERVRATRPLIAAGPRDRYLVSATGAAATAERAGQALKLAWSAVNVPPDMPTVGHIVTGLYREATGNRIDGVIVADPLAVAQVLKAGGPIRVDGIRLTAKNVARETLVQAYIRYADDNNARKRFLHQTARGTFDAFRRALAERPVELMQGLAAAARGRHVQVYSGEPAGQRAVVGLGVGGSAAAPAGSDYLMAVGINAGGNKLDAFLRRTLEWRIRLAADGSARAVASLTLHNTVPRTGMPRYIVGPYDGRFRAGVNEQIQTLYVAGGYGFTQASLDGRRVGAEAQAELGGLALTQAVDVPAGKATRLGYQLTRAGAAERLDKDRLRYRVLLRPQATVFPDKARVVAAPPSGWVFAALPAGAQVQDAAATWSGTVDQERQLVFELVRD